VEEEVMLLDPAGWALASHADAVIARLTGELAGHASLETHGSALELRTDPHATVADGLAQLEDLRGELARELAAIESEGGGGGPSPVHPVAGHAHLRRRPLSLPVRVDARARAARAHVRPARARGRPRSRKRDARHQPPALAPAAAARAVGQLALLAGSRDGLASARTPLFQAFPRVGIPRAFRDYEDYVSTIDLLLRCEAFPEPTFLWWDVRLQPRFGTIEVRIMDAQTTVADSAALTALVQCLVRLEATEGSGADPAIDLPEVLAENRFLAARDGVDASLIDARLGRRSPSRTCSSRASDVRSPRRRARLRRGAAVDQEPRRHAEARAPAGPRAGPEQAPGPRRSAVGAVLIRPK
jgi:carboxylate-amine ligase